MEQDIKTKEQVFVNYTIARIKKDHAFCASLRRAGNPATECQAWEHLVSWCDIMKEWERLPFAIVSAAIGYAKPEKDGYLSLGSAVAKCYERGNNSDAARAKLRRTLNCVSIKDICKILRPLLNLINSRKVPISYSKLLNDLRFYNKKTRLQWTRDFYKRSEDDSVNV